MRIRAWQCHPDFPSADESNFRGCWEFELRSGEQTIPHLHENGDEITITLEGEGLITVAEVSRTVQPGEVVFIPAQTNHFFTNPGSPILRGISVETESILATYPPEEGEEGDEGGNPGQGVQDLEHVISTIPKQLDESEALQLIIQLFDLAGHISEHIEVSLGLETTLGYGAITDVQRRVMDAVVRISASYRGGQENIPPRF